MMSLYSPIVWIRLLLQLLLFESTSIRHCFAGELRFCFNGPQRILYKDCPGGFVAKRIVDATCMYYYKADDVPNMDTYLTDNICEQAAHFRLLDADYQDFVTTTFQSIEFNADNSSGPTDGSDPAYDKCNQTCLTDWLEPKYWFPTKAFKDKADLNETAKKEFENEYVELTKTILIKIINEDEFDEDLEAGDQKAEPIVKVDFLAENSTIISTPMSSLMKLLAKSMKIILKRCSPFIEPSFYTLVFRTMIEYRKMNDKFPDMNILPLKRIFKILDKCETQQPTPHGKRPYFIINGTKCEDKYVAQTITSLKTNETWAVKLQEDSFRWGRLDPIIEAAWSAVGFVHAYCFDYFVEDMLHYSLYVKGMDQIFVQPIVEKHWMYPFPVGKGMTIWEMTYDTPDIHNQMNNLDACIQGAYSGSVFTARLDRPFSQEKFFANPEYEEDNSAPPRGWTKPVDEYWKMYERTGFQDMVDELGYCAESPNDVKAKTDDMAEDTCFKGDKKDGIIISR